MGIIKKAFKLKSSIIIGNVFVLTAVCVTFFSIYFSLCTFAFFIKYRDLITSFIVFVFSFIAVFTVFFYLKKKDIIYKSLMLLLMFCAISGVLLYFLTSSGFLDKIDSIEDFRDYIASFRANAVILFILLQFLQVVILPIPGAVAIGAGVLLFGPLKSAVYSFIGITLGSLFGFFIGRVLGYRVTCWLVGKDNLDKTLKSVKGKDNVLLTFMFIFPFFPDDVLCFVAGLSSMTKKYFTFMILLTRLLSCFVTAFSMNNSLIPFNTWWGILIWIILFIITALFTVIIYKHGDKIEELFSNLFKKNKVRKVWKE